MLQGFREWVPGARDGALGGAKFVNDYEEVVHGRSVQCRDTFQEITAESYKAGVCGGERGWVD